jgi:glycosyltransferase involved in cell wall biosynthesis
MPVYNGEKYLNQALESLLQQDFRDFELIISNNDSDDSTEEICLKYGAIDSRIRYHRQHKNIGAVNNFKYVLENATSPFFLWAAADDVWSHNWLSSLFEAAIKEPNRAVFGNAVYIDSGGSVIKHPANNVSFNFNKNSLLRRIQYIYTPHIYGKMILLYALYPREIFLRLSKDELSLTEYNHHDSILIFQVLKGVKFQAVKNSILYKRNHSESEYSKNIIQKKRIIPNLILKFLYPLRPLLFPFAIGEYIKRMSIIEILINIMIAPILIPCYMAQSFAKYLFWKIKNDF